MTANEKLEKTVKEVLRRPIPEKAINPEEKAFFKQGQQITGYNIVALHLVLRAADNDKSLCTLTQLLNGTNSTTELVKIIDDIGKNGDS